MSACPAACTQPHRCGDTETELYEWMALRRVSDGGMAKMGDHWFDGGRRIPGYVADALTAMHANRMVTLAERDVWGMQRAMLTDAGTVHYRQLLRQRQTARRRLDCRR